MSRKQVKHLIEANFMGIAEKIKHFKKPVRKVNNRDRNKNSK